jgi:hypothetical protein
MDKVRGLWIACGALACVALADGALRFDEDARGELQPYAQLSEGLYLDCGELISGPAPAPGTVRSERWQRAVDTGLDDLIVRPARRRGAYEDHAAEHSAWSCAAAR